MVVVFFFNDTAAAEIYTLSLHDALPISERHPHRDLSRSGRRARVHQDGHVDGDHHQEDAGQEPRELEEIGRAHRLNSSHANISYAVFCLKKKKHSYEMFTYTNPVYNVYA